MGPHEAQVGAQVGALLPPVAGHLRHQGPLAVDDLVVGDRQDVVLAVRVHHRERHLVVVVRAVHRVVAHVLERVVHPAHVPLQAEAQPAEAARPRVVGGPGDAVPGRGLLGDGHHARAAPVHRGVHLLEEGHRVQVLPAAVLVRRPLARLARVVQVEHRGDRVHAQPVDVELLAPVHGVRDEEVAHLAPAEVELQRAPVGMGGPQRVVVLVQRTPVELRERPVVAREVGRHPVHQHPDARLVQFVHQVLEVVGGAEPGRRRVEPGDLVAPGAAEGMLGDRHQLDMREAHLLDVGRELLGQPAVRQPRPPGRQVHLVDREGGVVHRGVRPVRQPLPVTPLVVRGVHDRGGGGRDLGTAGQRVGAQGARAVRAGDLELVQLSVADPRHEQLPDPGAAERAHREAGAVPEVEPARDPHAPRVRRPHREPGAGDALVGGDVRAERLPELLVPALADQMQVQLAEGGQEAVGVLGLVHRAVVRHQQPVDGDLGEREQGGEEAVAVVVQLRPQLARDHGDRPRVRAERAEGDPARHRVRAQHGVRIVVGAVQQPCAVPGVDGRGHGDLRTGYRRLCGDRRGGRRCPRRDVRGGRRRLRGDLLRRRLPGGGLPPGRGFLLGLGFLVSLGGHGRASWSGRARRRTAFSGTGSQSGRCRAS
ncbi:hypothetical protein SCANM63S_01506 [Streptomyces canarius]